MQIAIASGKGGTGKTTVATNLAAYYSRNGHKVSLIDCDVEEPNAHFFLSPAWRDQQTENVPVPRINTDSCQGADCRQCVTLCRFKALIWMVDSVLEFPELCHGCGLCELVCPANAVEQSTRELGISRVGHAGDITLFSGLLRIGEAMAPPLIKRVKQRGLSEDVTSDIRIVDCPPGATCPVVESLEGSDFVVLVAEPTPFGLHDLEIAVKLLQKLQIPFGVVVNRAGMGDDCVHRYLHSGDIPLLGNLPHSLEAAQAYSKGTLLIDMIDEYEDALASIACTIGNMTASAGES